MDSKLNIEKFYNVVKSQYEPTNKIITVQAINNLGRHLQIYENKEEFQKFIKKEFHVIPYRQTIKEYKYSDIELYFIKKRRQYENNEFIEIKNNHPFTQNKMIEIIINKQIKLENKKYRKKMQILKNELKQTKQQKER